MDQTLYRYILRWWVPNMINNIIYFQQPNLKWTHEQSTIIIIITWRAKERVGKMEKVYTNSIMNMIMYDDTCITLVECENPLMILFYLSLRSSFSE